MLKSLQKGLVVMLRSMTGYGRAEIQNLLGRFVAEIQSVNRKHLDVTINISSRFLSLEPSLRQLIGQVFSRGQITLKVSVFLEQMSPITVKPNLALAQQLYEAWNAIGKHLNIEPCINLGLLKEEKDLFIYEETASGNEEVTKAILNLAEQAIQELHKMRMREGTALQQHISGELRLIQKWVPEIAKLAPRSAEKYRQKLLDNLNNVLPNATENEERVLREICVFADRVDISEEIARFGAHLTHLESLLEESAQVSGKALEFYIQELQRETNTTGAKCSDLEIAQLVINIKTSLEKIREQIQNVE